MAIVLNGTLGLTTNSGTVISASTIGVGGTTPSASGAGISFPATQSASTDANTLDDYEEGSWTPSLGGTATYSAQRGTYTKIGRVVYVTGVLVSSSIGTGSTSVVSGLPFTTRSQDVGGIQVTYLSSLATSIAYTTGYPDENATTFRFYTLASVSAGTVPSAIFAGGTQVNFSGTYIV